MKVLRTARLGSNLNSSYKKKEYSCCIITIQIGLCLELSINTHPFHLLNFVSRR